MPRKRYSSEQIILKLREAEVLLSQGQTVQQACKTLEISEQTYYRWRREYGGMDTTKIKKLKELESEIDLRKENTRLKRLVADLSLDNAILKEVLSKKVSARPGGARQWSRWWGCSTCRNLDSRGRHNAMRSASWMTSRS
jgi:transposase-like protein